MLPGPLQDPAKAQVGVQQGALFTHPFVWVNDPLWQVPSSVKVKVSVPLPPPQEPEQPLSPVWTKFVVQQGRVLHAEVNCALPHESKVVIVPPPQLAEQPLLNAFGVQISCSCVSFQAAWPSGPLSPWQVSDAISVKGMP